MMMLRFLLLFLFSHPLIFIIAVMTKRSKAKKLMIFPEGKLNSKTMLPFKKGAFHIAIDGKVPILPVVISDFLNAKKMIFNPGKVTIKVLPRIDTSEYTKENIYDLVTHTRNIMIEELKKISTQKSD